MNRWQKVLGVAVVGVLALGTGSAWAQRASQSRAVGRAGASGPRFGSPLGAGTGGATVVSITPCRIVDTRKAGGTLKSAVTRAFKVSGSGAVFAAQGGTAGGCAIPAAAEAIEATVTAVAPAAAGYLRAWPSGKAEPAATFVNYSGPSISNAGHLPICHSNCPPGNDLDVRAYGGATHLVIDVSGYTIGPLAVNVSATGVSTYGSREIFSSKISEGQYQVEFDQDVSTCTFLASTGVSGWVANAELMAGAADTVAVKTTTLGGEYTSQRFSLHVVC